MRRIYRFLSLAILVVAPITTALCQRIETATIDPAAAVIIDRALTAMGGADAWQNVQAARVHGTTREENGKAAGKSYPFVTQHDWSTGQHLAHQYLTDSQGTTTKTFDPDKIFTPEQAAAVEGLPRHPGDNLLPALLPGALLRTIRDSKKYRIAIDPHPNWHPANQRTIAIYRAGVPRSYWPDQVWTFSTETGLPLRTKIAVVGRPGSPFYKTVTFHDFQTKNSLLVPVAADVLYPDRVKQSLTFDTFEFVPATHGKNLN
jgi:hypothetical protein